MKHVSVLTVLLLSLLPGTLLAGLGRAGGDSDRPMASAETPLYQYDAQCQGDHGKLVVSAVDIRWQDFDRPDRSQSWPYNVIRNFERNQAAHKLKLHSYDWMTYEFKLAAGHSMPDAVYEMIQSRLMAVRPPVS
jgi:hypothetical protein